MNESVCRTCPECDQDPNECLKRMRDIELRSFEECWNDFCRRFHWRYHDYTEAMLRKAVADVLHRQADFDAIDAVDARG